MLEVGSFRAQSCGGVSRRSFLKLGASVPMGLGLAGLSNEAQAAESVRAKSVILLWLWGAPSHLDTFDPKPNAPMNYRGPFSPISTTQAGFQISELLPRISQRTDKFSIIRSMVSSQPGHPDAGTVGLTGFKERPDPVHPSFGSIVMKHRGQQNDLPPYISLGQGIPKDLVRKVEGYGGGRLGQSYDPFMVRCSDIGQVDIPSLKLLDGLNPNRISDRKTLLKQLDEIPRGLEQAKIQNWETMFQRAYGLLTRPEARNAFDVTFETPKTRQDYGQTTFGQSCLVARRLAEAQVPFIQVNWSEYVEAASPNCDFGWDTHIYNFELLQDRHCPIFDRAYSALLDDLEDRGLLDSTLVVAMGEFGRTPKISDKAARDHWPRCYFSLWAGGGVKPGLVIGKSDELGEDPITPPITPLMAGTTIAELAGVDLQARLEMNVLENGHVIFELV